MRDRSKLNSGIHCSCFFIRQLQKSFLLAYLFSGTCLCVCALQWITSTLWKWVGMRRRWLLGIWNQIKRTSSGLRRERELGSVSLLSGPRTTHQTLLRVSKHINTMHYMHSDTSFNSHKVKLIYSGASKGRPVGHWSHKTTLTTPLVSQSPRLYAFLVNFRLNSDFLVMSTCTALSDMVQKWKTQVSICHHMLYASNFLCVVYILSALVQSSNL